MAEVLGASVAEIWVLLSTFNGARYLPALLDSLRAQSDGDWRMLVRDDGSSDDTRALLDEAARQDSRIEWCPGATERLGVTGSFGALMAEALRRDAAFFALCDQDDVWLPDKLARLRAAIGTASDGQHPVLAYSDLQVVDDRLNRLHSSFFAQSGAGRAWLSPSFWVLQHHLVPGCAMMGNRALLARCVPLPPHAVIHDWWILLSAASMGQVVAVADPLILYRQHGSNTIGAVSFVQKLARLWRDARGTCREKQQLFLRSMAQTRALMARLNPHDPQEARWHLIGQAALAGFLHESRGHRLWFAVFGGVRRVGLFRNILLWCVLWFVQPSHDERGGE